MKFILGFLTIALFSSLGLANITSNQEYVLNHSPASSAQAQLGTLVNRTRNLLVAKYSFAVQGGSTAADISLLTDLTKPLSLAKLPNKAIITNVWVEVVTAATSLSSNTGTVAFKAVNAADLLAASGIGTLVTFKQGIPAGTTTTFIKLTAEKTIKLTVATAALTAGKYNVWIEYVVGD